MLTAAVLVPSLKIADDLMLFCFGRSVPVTVTLAGRTAPPESAPKVRFLGTIGGREFEGYAKVSESEYQGYRKPTQSTAIVWRSSRNPCLGGRTAVLARAFGSLGQATGFLVIAVALGSLALTLVGFWLLVIPDHIKRRAGRT